MYKLSIGWFIDKVSLVLTLPAARYSLQPAAAIIAASAAPCRHFTYSKDLTHA